ncbi:MAG: hypothetical protein QHH07_10190 [Sedimentisphaerales bacterium]|nr:hypothetical protein [Sedimentisphaerales bacterium]
MLLIWIASWLGSAFGAYLLLEAAVLSIGQQVWDRPTRRFALISGLILGPIMLAISLELLLLTEVGKGIATIRSWRYKD